MSTRPSVNHDGQQRFDWNYYDRQGWIDQAELPRGEAIDGSGVSPGTMRLVLHKINDHLGNNPDAWPGLDRLASAIDKNKRTVIRAVQALQRLSLLIVLQEPSTRGGYHNRYRIVWTELQLLEPTRRAAWLEVMRGGNRGDMVSNRGDMVSNRGDMVSNRGDMVSPELPTNYPKNYPKNLPPLTSDRADASCEPQTHDVTDPPWEVVVSVLEGHGMSQKGTEGAITAAKSRELSPRSVLDLVERWERLRAHRPGVTIGWLYHWLLGTKEPPPDGPGVRNTSLTYDSTRREMVRARIVKDGRKAGAGEEVIAAAVAKAMAKLESQPQLST